MQLNLILKQLLSPISGQGKNGTWKKQELIFETDELFPKKICLTVWSNKVEIEHLIINNKYIVDFDIESRDYNGRWYTEMRIWKIANATVNDKIEIPINNNNQFDTGSDLDILPF